MSWGRRWDPTCLTSYLHRNEADGLVVRAFLLVSSVPQGGEGHAEVKVNSSVSAQPVAWAKNASQSERWPTLYGTAITDRAREAGHRVTYGPHQPTKSALDHPLVASRPRREVLLRIELETEFLERGFSAREGRVFVEPRQMWEFAEWVAPGHGLRNGDRSEDDHDGPAADRRKLHPCISILPCISIIDAWAPDGRVELVVYAHSLTSTSIRLRSGFHAASGPSWFGRRTCRPSV